MDALTMYVFMRANVDQEDKNIAWNVKIVTRTDCHSVGVGDFTLAEVLEVASNCTGEKVHHLYLNNGDVLAKDPKDYLNRRQLHLLYVDKALTDAGLHALSVV